MKTRKHLGITIASAVAAGAACVAVALAANTISMTVGGKAHPLNAIELDGTWYVSAADVAHALGNGTTFDSKTMRIGAERPSPKSTSIPKTATPIRPSPGAAKPTAQPVHTVSTLGGGFASDGTVAVRLVSVKDETSFQGVAPDPGAHFVVATLQVKNLTDVALPLYQLETSLMNGTTHVNAGQLYDSAGATLGTGNATPGQTVTYLDVFEINDGVAATAISVHPPFAPSGTPADLQLNLSSK